MVRNCANIPRSCHPLLTAVGACSAACHPRTAPSHIWGEEQHAEQRAAPRAAQRGAARRAVEMLGLGGASPSARAAEVVLGIIAGKS